MWRRRRERERGGTEREREEGEREREGRDRQRGKGQREDTYNARKERKGISTTHIDPIKNTGMNQIPLFMTQTLFQKD